MYYHNQYNFILHINLLILFIIIVVVVLIIIIDIETNLSHSLSPSLSFAPGINFLGIETVLSLHKQSRETLY